MNFAIGRQEDGSYVLRFEQTSIRADVAVTRADLEALELEVKAALSPRGSR